MTQKKEDRVRVWHPEQKAEAHPLKEHLQAWLDQGWEQQADQPKDEGKTK